MSAPSPNRMGSHRTHDDTAFPGPSPRSGGPLPLESPYVRETPIFVVCGARVRIACPGSTVASGAGPGNDAPCPRNLTGRQGERRPIGAVALEPTPARPGAGRPVASAWHAGRSQRRRRRAPRRAGRVGAAASAVHALPCAPACCFAPQGIVQRSSDPDHRPPQGASGPASGGRSGHRPGVLRRLQPAAVRIHRTLHAGVRRPEPHQPVGRDQRREHARPRVAALAPAQRPGAFADTVFRSARQPAGECARGLRRHPEPGRTQGRRLGGQLAGRAGRLPRQSLPGV